MYLKQNFIGGGGFGKVYLVADGNGTQYALKELNLEEYASDRALCENLTKRFKQEAIKQAEVNHSNVIKVHFQQLDANPPYFVMELAQCTFNDVINGYFSGATPYTQIKKGLFDILSGLGALHEIGIWHRDLKPQNVLLVPPDRFAISDFGLIAVRDGQGTTLTMTGTTAGTRDYSPPEFMQDFKKADASSDFYSFGAILHDIFVQRPRVPYSELRDGHGKIGEVIARCTKAKQYLRYRNVEELRADLFEALVEFEASGAPVATNLNLDIFDSLNLSEGDCDQIIEMIDKADSNEIHDIYRAFTIEFIERAYFASSAAANYIAEQYAKYVLKSGFEFSYCDVIADRLVHFLQQGDVGTKAICLLALLEMGASHNRWYVENRFVKFAGPDCPLPVVRRMLLDAKTNGVDIERRLGHLLWSISVRKENLHPQISMLVP